MKSIFQKSYWFWVISKIILILILFISTISILSDGGLRTQEFLVNFIALITSVLLSITLVQDFSFEINFKILKTITGGLLALFSLGLVITLLTVSDSKVEIIYFLGFLFAFWMFLIALFDLLQIRRGYSPVEE